MAWWTPPPSLSARHAWDGFHVAGGQLLDQVSSNHITYGTTGGESASHIYLKSITGVTATPGKWPLASPVSLTVAAGTTVLMLVASDSAADFLYSATSAGWLLRIATNGMLSGRGAQYMNYSDTNFSAETFWCFAATREVGGSLKLYLNGRLINTITNASYIPADITHIGSTETAHTGMSGGDMVAGLAVYTGIATQEELFAIEVEARRELRAGTITGNLLSWPTPKSAECDASAAVIAGVITRPENNDLQTVSGVVTELGLPVRRIVRLHEMSGGALMGQAASRASDGYYIFENLPRGYEYYVLSFDSNGVANMVGKDRVKT